MPGSQSSARGCPIQGVSPRAGPARADPCPAPRPARPGPSSGGSGRAAAAIAPRPGKHQPLTARAGMRRPRLNRSRPGPPRPRRARPGPAGRTRPPGLGGHVGRAGHTRPPPGPFSPETPPSRSRRALPLTDSPVSPHTAPCPLAAPRAPAPAGPRSLAGGRAPQRAAALPQRSLSAPRVPRSAAPARCRRYFLLKGPRPPRRARPREGRPGAGGGTAVLVGEQFVFYRVFSILLVYFTLRSFNLFQYFILLI